MKIANRKIGPGHPIYIIAEAGLAHLGSLDLAMEMLHAAKEAGADAFKTQFWDINNSSSLYSGARKPSRCLDLLAIDDLAKECEKIGIHFLCTPHDEYALGHVAMRCPAIKIGSGEKGNWEFIHKALLHRLPIIMSIQQPLFEGDRDKLNDAFDKIHGAIPPMAFLFCISKYPTTWEDVKGQMPDFRKSLYDGWSSHTASRFGIDYAAVAAGAKIIEKHISPPLSHDIETSNDMHASIITERFGDWCREIRIMDELFP